MPQHVTLWTLDGCPRCDAVRQWFREQGYQVEVKDASEEALARETAEVRRDVLAEFAMRDGEAPLAAVGAVFISREAMATIYASIGKGRQA